MKRLLIGISAAASLIATGALAADLPVKAPYTKAPVYVDPGYNWTGFYVGLNAGYSWGRAGTDGNQTGTQSVSEFTAFDGVLRPGFPVVTTLATTPLTGRTNANGFVGGGQAGYNWQFDRSWLFGVESDIQGTGESGTGDVCFGAPCATGTGVFTANYKLDWFGTVRGRVGFLPSDRVLLYVTGGLAYGGLSASAPLVPLSWGSTNAGWTAGAGGEVAIDHHWSIKLEYLYMDLGNVGSGSFTTTNVVTQLGVPVRFNTVTTTALTNAFNTRFTDNILRVGVNYKFDPAAVVAKY